MIKFSRTLSLAALALAGASTAVLAQPAPGGDRPDWNRTMTRAEAQTKATEMFAKMDANSDGRLDQADRAARQAQRFAMLDTDKNGSLSQAEFAAAHAKREGRGGPDGAAEGRRMGGHKMGGHRMGGGKMMGRMADANKDGTVTRDEFLAAHNAHFDKMDANKDGSVTGEERKAARQAMRAEMGAKWGAQRGAGRNAPQAN